LIILFPNFILVKTVWSCHWPWRSCFIPHQANTYSGNRLLAVPSHQL